MAGPTLVAEQPKESSVYPIAVPATLQSGAPGTKQALEEVEEGWRDTRASHRHARTCTGCQAVSIEMVRTASAEEQASRCGPAQEQQLRAQLRVGVAPQHRSTVRHSPRDPESGRTRDTVALIRGVAAGPGAKGRAP